MKSPVTIDKEIQKQFNITPENDVSPVQKLSFLQSQLGELQTMAWRSRVDVVHARRLQASDNAVLKAKGVNNEADHLNQVEQFMGGIVQIKEFIEELRKEYPELAVED